MGDLAVVERTASFRPKPCMSIEDADGRAIRK
jgi:hypothetical protein